MKKVLVTGAAGFIASEVCQQLLKSDVNVIGIDNLNDYYDIKLKNYRLENLKKHPRFQFVQMDIENRKEVKDLFTANQFDVVFNLAARAGVRYSMENPHVYMTTNAMGTLNLLDEMKNNKVDKFVLASTSSLYAGQEMPFDESLPVNTPISPYAASKKAAEMMAYSYHYLYGIDVSVVRYFTVYGPCGRPDMSMFRFIEWMLKGQKIQVYGDGKQARDFTYVEDIARGTILAAKKLGFQTINLGGGDTPTDLLQLLDYISESLGKEYQLEKSEYHKADIKATSASIAKARELLGWVPKYKIKEGLEKTVEWHLQNRELLGRVEFN